MSVITQVIDESGPRTDSPESIARAAGDAQRVLDTVYGGGLAVVALDVAYAIVGHREAAIRRIFDAKKRSYEKPSGLLGDWKTSQMLHQMEPEKHEIVRGMIERAKLPFSVVAPFDPGHAFFSLVDPFVMRNSSKAGTIDILLNAGALHDEIARQSREAGRPIFGSSANTSLTGSKYRLADVDAPVREAATIAIDHGVSKYANDEGRSSTIIDFRDFTVLRPGVAFDRLKEAFKELYGVELKDAAAK